MQGCQVVLVFEFTYFCANSGHSNLPTLKTSTLPKGFWEGDGVETNDPSKESKLSEFRWWKKTWTTIKVLPSTLLWYIGVQVGTFLRHWYIYTILIQTNCCHEKRTNLRKCTYRSGTFQNEQTPQKNDRLQMRRISPSITFRFQIHERTGPTNSSTFEFGIQVIIKTARRARASGMLSKQDLLCSEVKLGGMAELCAGC